MGGIGRSDKRTPGAFESRADLAPVGNPSVRAGVDGRASVETAPVGVHGVQRGLRRGSNGNPPAAKCGGASRSASVDVGGKSHPGAQRRKADNRADAGYGVGNVLLDENPKRRARRRKILHGNSRSTLGVRAKRIGTAGRDFCSDKPGALAKIRSRADEGRRRKYHGEDFSRANDLQRKTAGGTEIL